MVNDIIKKAGFWLIKRSPVLLSGLAVGGVISTTILALKAGPKAQLIVDDFYDRNLIREENGEYIYNVSKGILFQEIAPVYIPVIVSGALTIVCIIMSNSIHMKRQALIASLYSASETALKEYQTKMTEKLGAKEARQIKDEIAGDRLKAHPVDQSSIIVTGDGESRCYDMWSDRYFFTDYEKLRAAQNDINRDILSDMWASVNDFYYIINLAPIPAGENVGFDPDNMMDISFSSHLDSQGRPCLVIDYTPVPRRYW